MKVTGAFSDDRECYAPNKMKSDPSATATGGTRLRRCAYYKGGCQWQ